MVQNAEGGTTLKNAYAVKLQLKKNKEIANAHADAFTFCGNLIAIALNNLYGFGKDRLTAVEKEAQRILEEEFGDDPEVAAYGMKRRIEQIRGKDWENEDS